MPAAIIAIVTLLARTFVARLLVGAGLAVVSFTFINDLVTDLQNRLQGYLNDLPSDVLYVIDLLNFDFYLSVLMSAYGLAISIKSAKMFLGKA